MNLLYFCLTALVCFFITIVWFEKKNIWNTIICGLGIAGVVNANFFHSGNYPIDVFGLNFGIDAIIYTLFIYTVILNYFYFGKRSAIIYTFSGAAAVFLAGAIGVTAVAFNSGHSVDAWKNFADFTVSAASTIVAGVAMIFLIDLLKKKTKIYDIFLVIIGIVVAIFINSTLYYCVHPFIHNYKFDIYPVLTSYLGKFIALLFACGSFISIKLIEKHLEKKRN